MTDLTLWFPISERAESAVSVFVTDDEKLVGWSRLTSEGTVLVDFPDTDAPDFVTGVRANLMFSGDGDMRLLVPNARVVRCSLGQGQTSYQFEVSETQWQSIRSGLRPRVACRVSPKAQVNVDLAAGEWSFEGLLEDISEAGVGIRIESSDEKCLLGSADVHLGFSLPDDEHPFHVIAHVRDRALVAPGCVRCGLEFDVDATRNFEDHRTRIARYVRNRRREDRS